MFQKEKIFSFSSAILLMAALINVLVIKAAFAFNEEFYWALLFSLPALAFAIYYKRIVSKKGTDDRKINSNGGKLHGNDKATLSGGVNRNEPKVLFGNNHCTQPYLSSIICAEAVTTNQNSNFIYKDINLSKDNKDNSFAKHFREHINENINNNIKSENDVIWAALLSDCLNRWAQPRGKGIPQGYTAADILAKLYLTSVDINLRNEGFDHLRYVDDIRVFCRTHRDAQQALLLLTELLRSRGLNIQSAKTSICEAREAALKIDGVSPIIGGIHDELLEEIREQFVDGGYGTVSDLERLTAQDPEHPPIEVLERAFAEYFRQGTHDFDKTLFHYLLTRLAATESRIAVGYCLNTLQRRPEETGDILRYFRKAGLTEPEHGRMADFLRSNDSLYNYQNYLILKFYLETDLYHEGIVAVSRQYTRDVNLPPWLRAYATAIVGSRGDPADMEAFEARYPYCRDNLERATLICASRNMEARRRNEFHGRARRDGDLEQRACRWVRARDNLNAARVLQI